ncbi:MAG: PLD nuclease N-terminal domain-containing protein [Lacisediminihabitans sp.]
MKNDLSTLPAGILVAIGVLAVLELALNVVALVSLYRRPLNEVALGNKWVWVAIILLVNFLGAILYFAIGRKATTAAGDPEPIRANAPTSDDVAESLYGRRDESGNE